MGPNGLKKSNEKPIPNPGCLHKISEQEAKNCKSRSAIQRLKDPQAARPAKTGASEIWA